jgi:hypothetical protein
MHNEPFSVQKGARALYTMVPRTMVQATIVSAYVADLPAMPGRTRVELQITSSVSFASPTRFLLGFHTKQPEKIRRRDEQYLIMCGLDPFEQIKASILPFQMCFDNLGDGQLGCYIRWPREGDCHLEILQEGKRPKIIDELIAVLEDKKLFIARAVIGPLQTLRIEEV